MRRSRKAALPAVFAVSTFIYCLIYISQFINDFSIQEQDDESLHIHGRILLSTDKISQNISKNENVTYVNSSIVNEKIEKCIPPAIEQFPKPLMSQSLRKNGGILLHLVVSLYTFLGLAIVCDDYFVPSLEKITEALHLSSDVAGATFMAAGSSAPELAASIIGIFISKDDIGIGTVVGSAVFNITFVISVCGLLSGLVLQLHWWPIVRDCSFYLISILLLVFCILDGFIEWYESITLLCGYTVYIIMMIYNKQIFNFFNKCCTNGGEDNFYNAPGEKDKLVTGYKRPIPDKIHDLQNDSDSSDDHLEMEICNDETMENGRRIVIKEEDEDVTAKGCFQKCINVLSKPLEKLFYISIPDCRLESWAKWYIITLTMAIVWISVFSYLLVWMITIIGSTLNISDAIMGLTFLAAGVSMPDALSSLAVAKIGLGDMAVSNAIGSNVFDILLCLGFPWFLKTCVISRGYAVPVYNKGMLYSTISLIATVIFLLVTTHFNGWKLNRKYGVILLIWYFLFTIITTMYAFGLFGSLSIPSCPTNY